MMLFSVVASLQQNLSNAGFLTRSSTIRVQYILNGTIYSLAQKTMADFKF